MATVDEGDEPEESSNVGGQTDALDFGTLLQQLQTTSSDDGAIATDDRTHGEVPILPDQIIRDESNDANELFDDPPLDPALLDCLEQM